MKTPGGVNISTHQALIFLSLDVIRQASVFPDFLVAVCDDDLIDQHVVPTFEVVNANLRIVSDFRRLNYPSVRGLVSDRLAELVVCRFAALGLQHYRLARSEVGHGAKLAPSESDS